MKDKSKTKLKVDRRNKSLKEIAERDPGFGCEGAVGRFVSAYLLAEVFAMRLIEFYRSDRKLDGKKLQVDVLISAVRHFEMSMEESIVKELFTGGEGKRGFKTARQLRNGYLHTLSHEDRKEIIDSAESTIFKLNQFIKERIYAF